MKKLKLGIFGQLVTSYIVFSILVIISFIICLLMAFYLISSGNIDTINPYEVVDDKGEITSMEVVKKLGGWVEKLDNQNRVIKVYGDKKDDNISYTQREIYEYLNASNKAINEKSTEKYRGFIKEVKENEKSFYYLIKVERNAFQVNYKIMLSNNNTLSSWYTAVSAAFLVLFFINCIFLSLHLSRKIKKPLKEITKGMEKVRNGQEHIPLDFKAQVEFEEIKDTFNIMMERLQKEKKEKELIEQSKKKMLLDLSHDIKTPVSTIKSYANALEAGLVKEEKKNLYYKIIDLKAVRVSSLIDDMFTILKMDSTEYILNKQPEDICELIREILVEHYEEMEDKNIILNVNIPEEKIIKNVDKALFQRVISNLISNGIKYCVNGKFLNVTVEHDSYNRIIIEVEQEGNAIEENIRNTLFEPFVRGDKARRTNGGTGLGLAISKAIIEKHGGTIKYIEKDKRNCFRVTII